MLRPFAALLLTGSFIALAACSGDEEESAKYPSVDSFCQAKAGAECQLASKCGVTKGGCESLRKDSCMKEASAAQTGSRAYQAKAAEACVDKANEVFGKSTITPTDRAAVDEAFQNAFRGTVAELKGCTTTYECSGEMICDKTLCAKKTDKSAGDLCGNPGEVCGSAAYCSNVESAVYKCFAKKAQGEMCDSKNAPCGDGLRCNNTCSSKFAAGTACATNDDCASDAPLCDQNIGAKCSAGLIPAPGAPACKEFGG